MTDSPTESHFIFVVCQRGAERAVLSEISANHPGLNLAFSRPGFVTLKISEGVRLSENFTLRSTLARTWGWSLGKCSGESANELAKEIAGCPTLKTCQHLHVWQRDRALPGKDGFEPGITPLATEVCGLIAAEQTEKIELNRVTAADERVFDVILVEPNEWWYGYHVASHVAGRWPGGAPLIDTSVETCSRAYFKLKEALLWSGITIQPDDICVELGSAPGGACQLLLEMGAKVIGVDPAEMEDEILKHENFTFQRKRSSEVRKRDLASVKWMISDMSVTPNYTLDAIEEIVTHDRVSVTGLVMTMKLTDWKLVDDVPALMKRVQALGFKFVRSRQLAFNRREFCMVAVKDRFALRASRRKKQVAPPRDRPADTTKPSEPSEPSEPSATEPPKALPTDDSSK